MHELMHECVRKNIMKQEPLGTHTLLPKEADDMCSEPRAVCDQIRTLVVVVVEAPYIKTILRLQSLNRNQNRGK